MSLLNISFIILHESFVIIDPLSNCCKAFAFLLSEINLGATNCISFLIYLALHMTHEMYNMNKFILGLDFAHKMREI